MAAAIITAYYVCCPRGRNATAAAVTAGRRGSPHSGTAAADGATTTRIAVAAVAAVATTSDITKAVAYVATRCPCAPLPPLLLSLTSAILATLLPLHMPQLPRHYWAQQSVSSPHTVHAR